MAEIVAFPTDAAFPSTEDPEETTGETFLLKEGLELLADYRAIADDEVRVSLRALIKSLSLRHALSSSP